MDARGCVGLTQVCGLVCASGRETVGFHTARILTLRGRLWGLLPHSRQVESAGGTEGVGVHAWTESDCVSEFRQLLCEGRAVS